MKETRTQRFLSGRSIKRGYDGESQVPSALLQDPTFVFRLSWKFSGPSVGMREALASSLSPDIEQRPVFFLDTNLWDVNVETELWQALIGLSKDIVVIPQVKTEVQGWLTTHENHLAARAMRGPDLPFTMLELPTPWTPAWDAYAYYVALLAMRRRVLKLGEILFTESKGRNPSHTELVDYVSKAFGERGLSLVYKRGASAPQASSWLMNTDESLVYLAAAFALAHGRSTVILTKDQDVLEQFYKLWWLLDTHYRAMLLANEHVHDPFRYPIESMPDFRETRGFFDMQNAILIRRGRDRMTAVLPKHFDFIPVECWHVAGAMTKAVFGAERQMNVLLDAKGRTGGLVSGRLGAGRNLHPWLPPLPLHERIADSIAVARDRSFPVVGSNAQIGAFDITHAVNTQERFSVFVTEKDESFPSPLWTNGPLGAKVVLNQVLNPSAGVPRAHLWTPRE